LPLQLDAPASAHLQRWPADVEYAGFMVAREALNNALRHARAHRIELFVDGDAQWLTVQVRDDGCGMPERGGVVRPGHLGMVGMRERAQAIGAVLRIESLADAGTTVTLQWGEPGEQNEPPVPDR
jgi:signal transduction histidine kinase